MTDSSLISQILNGPERSLALAILLISFVIGVLITWFIWRRKVRQLENQLANEKANALQHEAALKKAEEEIELKEGDLKKAGLANIKLRQDFDVINQQKEDYMTEFAVVKDQVKDISTINSGHKQTIENLENQILGLKTKNAELAAASSENQSSANTNVEVYTLKTKLTKINSELASAKVAIKNLEEERDTLKKVNEAKPMASAPTPTNGVAPKSQVVKRVVRRQATPAAKTIEPTKPKVTKRVVQGKAAPAKKVVTKAATPKAATIPSAKKTAPKKKAVKKVEKERLRKVEGIGPKIEQLLHDAGILSFKQLSKSKGEKLKKILAAGGSRYKMHDPTTWPEQAAMAAKGEWDKLKSYQDFLKGGVDTSKK